MGRGDCFMERDKERAEILWQGFSVLHESNKKKAIDMSLFQKLKFRNSPHMTKFLVLT
jgi:hypothetical protein